MTSWQTRASVCSLIAETRKDGFIDVTQSYNNIISSISEAEEAAKMAAEAANSTVEVRGRCRGLRSELFNTPADMISGGFCSQSLKDQDLNQTAGSLKNHSVGLKDEAEKLNEKLNNSKHGLSAGIHEAKPSASVCITFFCLFPTAGLKPQLRDAQRRLEDAKTKRLQLMKDLQELQNNLNATKSTTV